MAGSSSFWICVVFFVQGTCHGANLKSGDEIYLDNKTCALHRGWVKCTDTLLLNKCTTQKDGFSSLTIYTEDGTDIENGDLVALSHASGKWLDCTHDDAHCGVEAPHAGDTGTNAWPASTQQHYIIRNKDDLGPIIDGSKVFLEYEWEKGQCLRPSEDLLFGSVLLTDVCNEHLLVGSCDQWTITTATPIIPTDPPLIDEYYP